MSEEKLSKYYTINFEKYMDMLRKIDNLYHVVGNLLQEHVAASPVEEFAKTPVADLSGYFAAVNELREYLDDIINNPTEEEIDLIIKNKIKDVLVTLEDLSAINIMFEAVETYNERLFSKHNISIITN